MVNSCGMHFFLLNNASNIVHIHGRKLYEILLILGRGLDAHKYRGKGHSELTVACKVCCSLEVAGSGETAAVMLTVQWVLWA